LDNIDKTVEKLVTPFSKIQDALIQIGIKANGKLTPAQVAELDMNDIIMNELGGAELVFAIEEANAAFALSKNPNLDAAIGKLGNQFFVNDLTEAGEKVKKIVSEAFVNELSEEQLKGMLANALSNLTEAKIGALLNTTIRTTEATAYAELVSDLPEGTTFEYVGPKDGKNRPFCAEWVGNQITLNDLKNLYNDDGEPAITARGGYNCRHNWEIVK